MALNLNKKLILIVLLLEVGCTHRNGSSLRADMHEVYANARKLFTYVWSPDLFQAPSSEQEIKSSLDGLIAAFGRVGPHADSNRMDPGFRITLASQLDLLRDSRSRFVSGQKDYANWKLRSVASHCVSCHSRIQAPFDFIGDLPLTTTSSPRDLLTQGEFLLATRQFDQASEHLLGFVRTFQLQSTAESYVLRALKDWLTIQIRVKNDPAHAEEVLTTLRKSQPCGSLWNTCELLERWSQDSRRLAEQKDKAPSALIEAKALLTDATNEGETESGDNLRLVPTLRASALLHAILLQSDLPADDRRQATYLLAKAYAHLPIALLTSFRSEYLETTIRQYPQTPEAKDAFKIYERFQNEDATGSSGTHLDADQIARLEELKRLAGK